MLITIKEVIDYLSRKDPNITINLYWCVDCLNTNYPIYMLEDKIWYEELKMTKRSNLCASCLTKRLGRKLVLEDFQQEPPCNQLYIEILKQQ